MSRKEVIRRIVDREMQRQTLSEAAVATHVHSGTHTVMKKTIELPVRRPRQW